MKLTVVFEISSASKEEPESSHSTMSETFVSLKQRLFSFFVRVIKFISDVSLIPENIALSLCYKP